MFKSSSSYHFIQLPEPVVKDTNLALRDWGVEDGWELDFGAIDDDKSIFKTIAWTRQLDSGNAPNSDGVGRQGAVILLTSGFLLELHHLLVAEINAGP